MWNRLKKLIKNGILRAYSIGKKEEAPLHQEYFDLFHIQALRGIAAAGDQRIIYPMDKRQRKINETELKIGFFGNIANNAYRIVKCLQQCGYQAELVIEDEFFDDFVMNRPSWEDVPYQCDTLDEANAYNVLWRSLYYVRSVCYDPALQEKYQGRIDAVPEVQALYKEAFSKDIPKDIALVLAQQMGHWPLLLSMRRYDIVQFSGDIISLGMFCPVPYVAFPTGDDLFVSPFEESILGLSRRAGYRRSSAILVYLYGHHNYLDRMGLFQKRYYAPIPIDESLHNSCNFQHIREEWRKRSTGEVYILNVCRQSWERNGNDRLIRAFAKFIHEVDTTWRLVLMHWGTDVKSSEKLIEELGIAQFVIWECFASKPILREKQLAADIIVDQLEMHGYDISMVESMSAGKPLIINVEEDANPFSSFHTPPPLIAAYNEETVYKALLFLRNPLIRKQRGEASRNWVMQNHGCTQVASNYIATYKSILESYTTFEGDVNDS